MSIKFSSTGDGLMPVLLYQQDSEGNAVPLGEAVIATSKFTPDGNLTRAVLLYTLDAAGNPIPVDPDNPIGGGGTPPADSVGTAQLQDEAVTSDKIADAAVTPQKVSSDYAKDVAGGVAGLDGSGMVNIANLPVSGLQYQGNWDASTNIPTLSDGTSTSGNYYRCSAPGTQNLGSGDITFTEGDIVIYNRVDQWERIPAASGVVSVNGKNGIVELTIGDIGGAANPTASAGLSPVNGVATTYMRSDAAPSINQGIKPTWTQMHTFSHAATFTEPSAVAKSINPQVELWNTAEGLDEKRWNMIDARFWRLRALSDDGETQSTAIHIDRSGSTVASIGLYTNDVERLSIDSSGNASINNAAMWHHVAANTDPDTLIARGIYQSTGDGGLGHANMPADGTSWSLSVGRNSSSYTQYIEQVYTGDHGIYFRTSSDTGSTWSNWIAIIADSSGPILTSQRGVANGVASLGADGKVPSVQLPASSATYSGAKVGRSSDFIVPNNTGTAIEWNSEEWDTDDYHDNVTNNTRLTAPQTGKYDIKVMVTFQSNGTGIRGVGYRINGSGVTTEYFSTVSAVPMPNETRLNGSTELELTEGDYVEFFIYQTSGDSLEVYYTESTACIRFLGN